MSARLVLGIVAVTGVSISAIVSILANIEMVGKVNAALPSDLQFSPSGWYLPKTLRLHREYRRLFPDGFLLRRFWIAVATAILCLLLCAWAVGFFS